MFTFELVGKYDSDPDALPVKARKLLDGLKKDRFVRIEVATQGQ